MNLFSTFLMLIWFVWRLKAPIIIAFPLFHDPVIYYPPLLPLFRYPYAAATNILCTLLIFGPPILNMLLDFLSQDPLSPHYCLYPILYHQGCHYFFILPITSKREGHWNISLPFLVTFQSQLRKRY